LAKSLVAAKEAGSDDAGSIGVSDILRSFEDHSAMEQEVMRRETAGAGKQDKIIADGQLDEIWRIGRDLEDL